MRKLSSYIKSFISVVLMMSVLLMMTPVWGLTSDSSEIIDENEIMPLELEEEDFTSTGNGLEGNPYKISKPGHLLKLANDVSKGITYSGEFFELTESINLNNILWTPIGYDGSHSFQGTFNGNDKDIIGLYVDAPVSSNPQGLFGYVNGGTIKNLTVRGEVYGGKTVGGIVGRNTNTKNGKIDNCTFYGKVTGSGNTVGGIVGENKTCPITNCENYGTVTGIDNNKDYTGGIVGYNDQGTLQNCHNHGIVSGNTSVGGIAGGNSGGTIGGSDKEKEGCTNNKDITGTGNMVGGIVGKNESGTIECCTNKATISGVGAYDSSNKFKSSDYVGGIVGKNGFVDNQKNLRGSGTVLSCENEGEVKGETNVGGIAGRNEKGKIDDCTNYIKATVNCTGNTVGGVAGSNGDATEDCLIKRCKNEAAVRGGGSGVGGVVGENKGTVEVCYNIGKEIKGGSNVGGVVGNNNQASLQNCYNTGDVNGNSSVGGIVGSNTSTVDKCYNVGKVNDVYGGAMGSDTGSTTNCFYFTPESDDGSSGSVTAADADDFKEQGTFDNSTFEWDFADTWKMGTTKDNEIVRPVLIAIPEHPLDPLPHTPVAATYTVTFDYQDNVTARTTKTYESGTAYGNLPTPPERTGYTFKGWFTAPGDNGTQISAADKVTGDLTLYAHWEKDNNDNSENNNDNSENNNDNNENNNGNNGNNNNGNNGNNGNDDNANNDNNGNDNNGNNGNNDNGNNGNDNNADNGNNGDADNDPSGDGEPSDSTGASDENVGSVSSENASEATISGEASGNLKEEGITDADNPNTGAPATVIALAIAVSAAAVTFRRKKDIE